MFPVIQRSITVTVALVLASAAAAIHAQGSAPDRRDRPAHRSAAPPAPGPAAAPSPAATAAPSAAATAAPSAALAGAPAPARASSVPPGPVAPTSVAPAADRHRPGHGHAGSHVHAHPSAPRVVHVSHPHRPAAHRPAIIHTHGPSVRVWVGSPPVYYPSPYWVQPVPAPYVYRPSPWVIVPPAPPPVYIERADSSVADSPKDMTPGHTQATPQEYWYWCVSRSAYHPIAPDCPEGWIAVPPRPAGTQ